MSTGRSVDPKPGTESISRALRSAADGKSATELLPLVYDELRRTARAQIAKSEDGQTLQATALVHEAWLRVVGEADPGWDCRAHFFGAAARAMRNILVEQYRRKNRLKRDAARLELNEDTDLVIVANSSIGNMLILDEALNRLEQKDPLKARVVMLRFFTGLTMEEVAKTLGLPLTRIEREWRFTRAWLSREVEGLKVH